MSKEKYIDEIFKFMSQKGEHAKKPRKLARQMGIPEGDYSYFRAAYKKLRDDGRLILGSNKALTLPSGETTVLGRFQSNPRGFGFIVPQETETSGDLFVPAEKTAGAMHGDLVLAKIITKGNPRGNMRLVGEIIEIKERGLKKIIGTLEQTETTWFVIPDGRNIVTPIIVRDIPLEQQKSGAKVVVDIIWQPPAGGFPEGIIMETLGQKGEPEAEITSVMRAHNLVQDFSEEAMDDAKRAIANFNTDQSNDDLNNIPQREDLTGLTIVTIDPLTARDYDDAISLGTTKNGDVILGVHIADVAHFVKEGTTLDFESKERGTSVYFPRHVVPMLPQSLSNGVCSLQEGVKRFTKSIFISYDKDGNITEKRLAETVIKSSKRLTYEEAQSIIDDKKAGRKDNFDTKIITLVCQMELLAKKIELRRKNNGMLHLNLPEVELILDDTGKVIDATPSDNSYTHKIIEMFMVEANDSVAEIFNNLNIPLMRRIHPKPTDESLIQLSKFVSACGYILPLHPTHIDILELVTKVSQKPESHAINLALLRSFSKATYSTDLEEHFALGSPHYCHFTSPIRRYPDLTVHRTIADYLRGNIKKGDRTKEELLDQQANFLSTRERIAQAAERELRLVLILGHLAEKVGDTFNGIITGVAEFGLFIQSPKFLVEGLVKIQDLGDDWWNVSSSEGKICGDMTGKVFKVGDIIEVKIEAVNISKRQLTLSLASVKKRMPIKQQRLPNILSQHKQPSRNLETNKSAQSKEKREEKEKGFSKKNAIDKKRRSRKSNAESKKIRSGSKLHGKSKSRK